MTHDLVDACLLAPPRGVNAWFESFPWRFCGRSFHDYWGEVYRNTRAAEPFVTFFTRPGVASLHEVAHLILAADTAVGDPYWGLGPIGDPFGDAIDPVEYAVFYVEELIWRYVQPELPYSAEPCTADVLALIGERPRYSREAAAQLIDTAREMWTVERAWAELERKRALWQGGRDFSFVSFEA